MHHTAGADTGFSKRGVYMSDPQYAKQGGEGGNCTLQALYPPLYSIYLLNGDGIKPSFGVGGSFIPPPPPIFCYHGFETASCLSNYDINLLRKLVILLVASSVTRSLQPNGKNFFAVHSGPRMDILDINACIPYLFLV